MKKLFFVMSALVCAASVGFAQTPLPNDPEVRVGKLDNGMTYYIRHNDKPAQRAEFYLASHVGAIQEAPDQDGLAHFLEHMCFNGLKNLPGKQMLEYLQSIGAEFGRNINASTGVEQTQYMLNNIPVIREGIIDTCLLVMHDYSHFVLCEPDEIDAERGVILEERRTRRNAAWRMHEQSQKYMYKGSKYADCTVIGSKENLETFKPESLVEFYQTWYRPDNQALIVVGDVDVDQIEAKVKTLFADIPAPVNPRPKDVIKIPDNEEPIVGILTDPEQTSSNILLLWKDEPLPREFKNTDVAFTVDILRSVIANVMNERLSEISSKADAPFMAAFFGNGEITETCDATLAQVVFKEGEAVPALKSLMTEIEKMKRYGFSAAEIQRAKQEIVSSYEKQAAGAASRQNSAFVHPLISNFVSNTPYMVPETELQLAKAICQALPDAAINQQLSMLCPEENIVAIYEGPQKEGLVNPTEEQILATMAEVRASEVQANAEEVIDSEFVNPASLKGSKVKKTASTVYGATEWVLKNGVTVTVLPTDYKKDQVIIKLVKDGGSSLIPDADVLSFEDNVIALFQSNSGISKYPSTTVSKMLAGKHANAMPFIDDTQHGINANCQPKDLETALQMLYLEFVDPRFDEEEFQVGMNQIKAVYPNLAGTPQFRFQTEMQKTIMPDNPRNVILDENVIANANLATIERNYRKLFKDAAGAKVYIVGNVELETLKPLVEKYIGSLPKGRKALKWVDTNEDFVQGNVINHFNVDMQTPKSTVLQVYNSYDVKYSVEKEVQLSAANYILDMIYVETLREEEGGTYGASSNMTISKYPKDVALVQVYFDTNPSSSGRLAKVAVDGLRKLAGQGPTEEQMTRVRENFKKNIPEKRISNSYWLSNLDKWYRYGFDYDNLYEQAVANLTAEGIKGAVQEVLASGNFIEVMMGPANAAEAE